MSNPTPLFQEIKPYVRENRLSCADAHKAAQKAGVAPLSIGKEADANGVRLTACQLGLFGYGETKKLDTEMKIPAPLETALDKAAEDGRISCLACWQIAENQNVDYLAVASACEIMELRIKPCQLGAF